MFSKEHKSTTVSAPKERPSKTLPGVKSKTLEIARKKSPSTGTLDTILTRVQCSKLPKPLLLLITPGKKCQSRHKIHIFDRNTAVHLGSTHLTESELSQIGSGDDNEKYTIMFASKYIDVKDMKVSYIKNFMRIMNGECCKSIKISSEDVMYENFKQIAKHRKRQQEDVLSGMLKRQKYELHKRLYEKTKQQRQAQARERQQEEELAEREEQEENRESRGNKPDRLENKLSNEENQDNSAEGMEQNKLKKFSKRDDGTKKKGEKVERLSYWELQQEQWKSLYEREEPPIQEPQQMNHPESWSKFKWSREERPILPSLHMSTSKRSERPDLQMHPVVHLSTTRQSEHIQTEDDAESNEDSIEIDVLIEDADSTSNSEDIDEPTELIDAKVIVEYIDRINATNNPGYSEIRTFFENVEKIGYTIYILPESNNEVRQEDWEIESDIRCRVFCFTSDNGYVGRIMLNSRQLDQQLVHHNNLIPRVKVVYDIMDIVPFPKTLLFFLRFITSCLHLENLYCMLAQYFFYLYTSYFSAQRRE